LPMPPMGLTDQQTADVLTYIRGTFEPQSPAVTTDEVTAVRAQIKERSSFWTAEELKK